jgi:hypothetical protein
LKVATCGHVERQSGLGLLLAQIGLCTGRGGHHRQHQRGFRQNFHVLLSPCQQ